MERTAISTSVCEERRIPTRLLGKHWSRWTRAEICTILSYYHVRHCPEACKLELYRFLNRLVRDRGLTTSRYHNIVASGFPPRHVSRSHEDRAGDEASNSLGSSNPPTKPCEVCSRDLNSTSFPKEITRDCNHEPQICLDCLSEWITSQSKTRIWYHVDCPAPTCSARLDYGNVRAFATEITFQRSVFRPFSFEFLTSGLQVMTILQTRKPSLPIPNFGAAST